MILAGDIGGTKCNLALYEFRAGEYQRLSIHRFESRDFTTFDAVIEKFLKETERDIKNAAGHIDAAGFGVAGPVINRQVKATNLPWIVDAAAVSRQLATQHIVLMNDLEATAHSVALMKPSEISVLNTGTASPQTTQALLAAGTGLGEAILFWDGSKFMVGSSEGGHTDFAPRDEREIEFLRFMKKRERYVSVELILSGRGFRVVHEFLDPAVRHSSFDGPEADSAPEITHLGLTGKCPICVETLEMWVSMYGSEAGNLALKVLARGGIWVAGGIAVKIRKKMEDGTFFRAFCEKEKFAQMLAQIPIYMVLNEDAPLIGAMSQAAKVAGHGKYA